MIDVPYGTVTHRLFEAGPDGPDSGPHPDAKLLHGIEVVLTPSIKQAIYEAGGERVTIRPQTIHGYYNSQGRLVAHVGDGLPLNVPATRGSAVTPTWHYRVHWRGAQSELRLDKSITLIVDQGESVDLANVIAWPVKTGNFYRDLLDRIDDARNLGNTIPGLVSGGVAEITGARDKAVDTIRDERTSAVTEMTGLRDDTAAFRDQAAAIRDDVQEISGLTGEDEAVAFLLGDRDSAARGAVLALAEPQGEVDPRTAVIQVSGDVTMPPTPYGHSHYVHPSVVHVPGGWNGYPYWMAITPLDGAGNNQEENPCIYASTDGDTWVEPAGIVNPITPPPGAPAYHADTELVLHNGAMYCFYTTNWTFEDGVSVYRCSYKTSTDGVTWSTEQTAYSYDRTLRRFQTPTIRVRDGVWHVFAVDEVTKKIVHMQGPSASGPWSEPIYGTLSMPLPAGRDVWHITVDWTGSEWHLLLNDTGVGASGSLGSLFFYRSMDEGRNWSGGQQLLHRVGPDWRQFYRSAWVAVRTGGRLSYDVWLNVFHIVSGIERKLKRGRLVFGAEPLPVMHERDMQAARMGYPSVLVYDDWSRPDGPLGNAPTGQEWVPVSDGSAASVSGGLVRFTAPSLYVADSGKADVYVEVDLREMSTTASSGCLVVRSNGEMGTYIFFGWMGALQLTMVNGGSTADQWTTPNVVGALTQGDAPIRLGVRAKGDKIIRYVNGIQLGDPFTIPPQYTALLNGTHHGFGSLHATGAATSAVGDVLIRSL